MSSMESGSCSIIIPSRVDCNWQGMVVLDPRQTLHLLFKPILQKITELEPGTFCMQSMPFTIHKPWPLSGTSDVDLNPSGRKQRQPSFGGLIVGKTS